jgi:hypothetical protein
MNVQGPGFWWGVFLGGAGVGAVCGMIPLFLGVLKDKTWLALGGFLACIAAGMIAGAIGALPLAAIVSAVIALGENPPPLPMEGAQGSRKRRASLGWFLVLSFCAEAVFLAAFWSMGMSLALRKSFAQVLVPAGASFGLTMAICFTVLWAVSFRPGFVRLSFSDRAQFLERLDREIASLGYRSVPQANGVLVYEPKTLVRTEMARIRVVPGGDEAVAIGPSINLKRLKKLIERA